MWKSICSKAISERNGNTMHVFKNESQILPIKLLNKWNNLFRKSLVQPNSDEMKRYGTKRNEKRVWPFDSHSNKIRKYIAVCPWTCSCCNSSNFCCRFFDTPLKYAKHTKTTARECVTITQLATLGHFSLSLSLACRNFQSSNFIPCQWKIINNLSLSLFR